MQEEKIQFMPGLKKATNEILLLKLLSESDMYGYQLTQALNCRSNDNYNVKEGSIYPILYRLIDQQYISCREEKVGKRRTRIYYHLEEGGVEYYKKLKNAYLSYIDLVDFLLQSDEGDIYKEKTKNLY